MAQVGAPGISGSGLLVCTQNAARTRVGVVIGASLQGRGCKSERDPSHLFWVIITVSWQPKPSPQFCWEVFHWKGCSDTFLTVSAMPQ